MHLIFLWIWGYYPEILYKDKYWSDTFTIEQFADHFIARKNEKDNINKEEVIEYLKEFSEDGVIHEGDKIKSNLDILENIVFGFFTIEIIIDIIK